MSESNNKPTVVKKKKWLRILGGVAGGLVILLLIGYFVGTSSAFFKSVILPRVGNAIGSEVTVAEAQISPFSRVLLKDLKVQPHGGEPLVTVKEVRAVYGLWAILHGNLLVEEVSVETPMVTLIENADGTSNLDAVLKALAQGSKAPSKQPSQSGKALQVDIKKVAINNGTFRMTKSYKGGGRDLTEMSGLNFQVSGLKNGQAGKLEIGAVVVMDKAAQPAAPAGALQAKLAGAFDITLTPDLKPALARGNTTLTVEKASGSLADLGTAAVRLDCELSPTELKQLAVRLTRADAVLGEVRLSGPFDTAKSEGKLRLEIVGVDKRALNLAGAASGLDFGTTTISATNEVEFTKGGALINTLGRWNVAHFQVSRQSQTSPTLELQGDYSIAVDRAASSVVVRTLNLAGTQNARQLLQAGLSSPMTLGWGGNTSAVGDAALNLVVTNFALADWAAFTGSNAPTAVANVTVKLLAQKAGRQLGFEVDTRIDQIATGPMGARVKQGDMRIQAKGSLGEFQHAKLDNYQLELTRNGQSALKVSGSGSFEAQTQDADLQFQLQAALAALLDSPATRGTNGALDFQGRLTTQKKQATLTAKLVLPPTARAKNELQLAGKVDYSVPAAITGDVKFTAEALDVSHYFELITGAKSALTNRPPAEAVVAKASAPAKEPDAVTLPVKNFTLDLSIGHLFLEEVDIANWKTTVLLDGSHVQVKPCELTLNQAPVGAGVDLDLSVPGYKYDITFKATAVPLAPLVNSFVPDRKGQLSGAATVATHLQGAGVTPAGWESHLGADLSLQATNLNLSVANVRSPLLNSVINVVVSIPDLIRNPLGTVDNIIGGIIGRTGGTKGGWADQLTATPIDVLSLQARVANGKVQLQPAEIRSAIFQVLAKGDITLAEILNDSAIQIPVQVALAPGPAGKIGLANAVTVTNTAYVSLPDFVTMKGTLGKPKTDLDKLAILKLAAKVGGGMTKEIGGAGVDKVGSLLNAAGDLFGGSKAKPDAGATNAPVPNTSTNASTNATPVGKLFDLFKKPK